MSRSILLVDDDPALRATIARFFGTRAWDVFEAADAGSCAQAFEREHPDVTVLDLELPGMNGLHLLETLRARDPDATVLLLTGHGDIASAVEAMRLGAENFLTKPIELAHLDAAAERAFEIAELRRQNRFFAGRQGSGALAELGAGSVMAEIAREVALLAQHDGTVLLQGETGTGKGHVAKLIHSLSHRARRPFVEVNCAGLSATFLDSELFGHERGAFTDAKEQKRGLFEIANGGTLLLDEVGDLTLDLQPKLLKVLESHRFRRLGGTREIEVDVRLIAASNRDVRAGVANGRFREDLYYRLAVLPLHMPALRDRGREAIVELAIRILEEFTHGSGVERTVFAPEALRALVTYAWPGNIRELRNVLERVMMLRGDTNEIRPEHLPPEIRGGHAQPAQTDPTQSLAVVEKRHVLAVMQAEGGNVTAAARVLKISRSALYEKLRRFQEHAEAFHGAAG